MDTTRRLSPNFTLAEFINSPTAVANRIDNTPPEDVVVNLTTLCRTILEPARMALGPLRINSGFRCPRLNAAVGGVKTSHHLLGYAADVHPLRASMLDFARWVKANCPFDQILLEFGTPENPAWIHVSCHPRLRRQVLRVSGAGTKAVRL